MLVKIESYFDGAFWCARGTKEDIFTQGETYDELLKNIREAIALHFEEEIRRGKTIEVFIMSEIEVNNVQEVAAGVGVRD